MIAWKNLKPSWYLRREINMVDEKIDLKELKKTLSSLSLLYVEDNLSLKEKAVTFFEKLFPIVYNASDGVEGLALFEKYRPNIVITDIQMPLMDGLEMAVAIKKIDKNTKFIITSAYDDKEYLLKTISIGASGYCVKPLKVEEITQILYTLALEISEECNKNVFNNYLHSIFNNQDNLIVMLKNESVILANNHALSFFNATDIEEFKVKFQNFETLLLPHDSFLYHKTTAPSCLGRVKQNMDKLYNVKITDKEKTPHHFILKLTHINDKDDFYILSLTDITELDLLALYDKNSLEHDLMMKDEKTIDNLLRAAKEAGAVVKIYNFYKGLVVCNNGVIAHVGKENCTIKSSFLQQKAAQFEKRVILNCELFPYDLQSSQITDINFHTGTIEFGKCIMLKTTPRERKYLVLEPDAKHKVNLFYDKHRFDTDIKLINISVESVRISLAYLPAGLTEGDEIVLDIVFSDELKPIIINSKAKVLKTFMVDKNFNIVAAFILTPAVHKILIDYMGNRQMKLIREFKGLQL